MHPLIFVFAALSAAPLLDRALRGRRRAEAFGDGFVQAVVVGLVSVEVLPEALSEVGAMALLMLGLGALLGAGIHRLPAGERSAGVVAVLALLLHSATDGILLDADADAGVVTAVVAHTVPVGLATWRIARARAGWGAAVVLLAATAVATAVGPVALAPLLARTGDGVLSLTQMAAAGVLLHVVAHLGSEHDRRAAGLGALAGVLAVAALALRHPWPNIHAEELHAARTFWTLSRAAAPALLAGYVVNGLLHAWTPQRAVRWLDGPFAAVRGALFGIPTPTCACGAPGVADSLRSRGAPVPAAVAFLIGGSTLTVAPLLVALPLLGGRFTIAWFLTGLIAAVTAGLTAPRLGRRSLPMAAPHHEDRPGTAWRFGAVSMVDHSAPWVLVGLGIAAASEPFLAPDAFAGLRGPVAIVLAAILGVPAYVCAAGAIPLAAVLLHKGAAASVVLAALLTGSTLSLSTLIDLRRRHGFAFPAQVTAVVVGVAVIAGLAIDTFAPIPAPALHLQAEAAAKPIELLSVVVLAALYAAALVRNGPQGFVEPLRHPQAPGERGHHHPHAHPHVT